jgi:hypothetical protein
LMIIYTSRASARNCPSVVLDRPVCRTDLADIS